MTVTRREFLQSTLTLGAASVFALYASDIAEVFSTALSDDVHVIWLQGSADAGCSISLIQGTHPDLVDAITDFKLSVDFHPNIMIPEGDEAVGVLSDAASGSRPVDVFILEGSVPDGNFGTVGEIDGKPVPVETWVKQLASQAKYVVAVGSCATWGGIPGAFPNPTNAKGLQFYKTQRGGALGADFKSRAGLPVVNIPGCPPHPDWITLTLADVLQGFVPELDSYQRPTAFFSRTVHDQCPRLGYYQKGEFSQAFGELRCLWKLGCKGPITYANCPLIKWNNGVNSCTIFGSGCRGCVDPSFPDAPLSPFFKEIEAVPAPLGVDAVTAGAAALGVSAAAILTHAIRRGPLRHKKVETEPQAKAGKGDE